MSKVKITLIKSLIGRQPKHIAMAKQLGLGRLNSSVVQPNNPCIRGLVSKISYLLNVEEVA